MSCLRLRCMLSIISLLSFEEGTLDDQLSDRLVTLYIICTLYISFTFYTRQFKVLQNQPLVFSGLLPPLHSCLANQPTSNRSNLFTRLI